MQTREEKQAEKSKAHKMLAKAKAQNKPVIFLKKGQSFETPPSCRNGLKKRKEECSSIEK